MNRIFTWRRAERLAAYLDIIAAFALPIAAIAWAVLGILLLVLVMTGQL